jgi:hypothetical protein
MWAQISWQACQGISICINNQIILISGGNGLIYLLLNRTIRNKVKKLFDCNCLYRKKPTKNEHVSTNSPAHTVAYCRQIAIRWSSTAKQSYSIVPNGCNNNKQTDETLSEHHHTATINSKKRRYAVYYLAKRMSTDIADENTPLNRTEFNSI